MGEGGSVSGGSVTSPTRQFVGRAAALTALTAGLVGGGYFAVTIAHTRREYSEVVPFGGWQPNLADAALTFACVVAFVLAIVGLRRFKIPSGVTVSAQVLVTVLSLTLGTGIAAAGDNGGKHLIRWASHHTSEARRYAALERLAEGDADHRPVPPRGPADILAAPPTLAAPLLTPGDLGTEWQYSFNPPVFYRLPSSQPLDAPASSYGVRAVMAALRWNGQFWQQDQLVNESIRAYPTRADARAALKDLAPHYVGCTHCGPQLRLTRIAGVIVWRYAGGFASYLRYRNLVVEIAITSFGRTAGDVLPERQILRLAIRRLVATAGRR